MVGASRPPTTDMDWTPHIWIAENPYPASRFACRPDVWGRGVCAQIHPALVCLGQMGAWLGPCQTAATAHNARRGPNPVGAAAVPTARARRGLLSSRRLVQGGRRLDSAHGHRGRSRTPYAWLLSSALACPAPRRQLAHMMHSSCVASCCRRLALARSSRRWEPGTACRHFPKATGRGRNGARERENGKGWRAWAAGQTSQRIQGGLGLCLEAQKICKLLLQHFSLLVGN